MGSSILTMNQGGLLGLFVGLLANSCHGSQLDEAQSNRLDQSQLAIAADAVSFEQKTMDTDKKRYGMNEMNKFSSMGMIRMEETCKDKKVAKKCKKTCELCDDGQGCNESYKMQQNLTCHSGDCDCVICTFTVDDVVDSVKYNGVSLGISGGPPGGATWEEEKVISFQSCCDNCPGVLEIKGTDVNIDNHCYNAGLLLRCTASRSSSPWHNFISDIFHWKVENDAIPCQDNGNFPINAGAGIPFIAAMNSFRAKKIWNNETNAILRGSPAFYIPY